MPALHKRTLRKSKRASFGVSLNIYHKKTGVRHHDTDGVVELRQISKNNTRLQRQRHELLEKRLP